MKGVILQPGYLPWLGFFNQMALADVFVYLDNVQFDRRGWRNRNRIKAPSSDLMLTVPVKKKGRYHQLLTETSINNASNWRSKHIRSIERNYLKAQFFSEYFPALREILETEWTFLLDLDYAIINLFRTWLGIETKTIRATSLDIQSRDKTGRLVEICRKVGITDYISGPLCENYMDYQQLKDAGIRLFFHEYSHPEYRQLYPPFISHLSALDLILNEGPGSLPILLDRTALKLIER